MSDIQTFQHRESRSVYDERGEYENPYTTTTYISNSTNSPITVLSRNNLPITYPALSGGNQRDSKLSVRTTYRFRSYPVILDTINNIQKYMKSYGSKNAELDLILTTLLKVYNNTGNTNRQAEVTVEHSYSWVELQEKKKLYCPSTDLFISLGNYHHELVHPFSREGSAYSEYYNFVENKKVSGIFIELIDNDNEINDRYLFAGKEVIKVEVHKDGQRPSGVYYTSASNNKLNETHVTPLYMSFTEAEEKIGLYKSKEEAISGGNPELLLKKSLQCMDADIEEVRKENALLKETTRKDEILREAEISKLKYDQDIIKAKLDADIASMNGKLETAKRENAMLAAQLEAKSSVSKDHYESRSYERKDNSDIIKTAAVCVTAAIGIFAIYAKTK